VIAHEFLGHAFDAATGQIGDPMDHFSEENRARYPADILTLKLGKPPIDWHKTSGD
jgi:hypothetical protein